jgi:hypothetical protein
MIATLDNRSYFDKFGSHVESLDINKDAKDIVRDIAAYYKAYPDKNDIDWTEFAGWCVHVKHPAWSSEKKDARKRIIENVARTDRDEGVFNKLLDYSVGTALEGISANLSSGVSSGIGELEDVVDEYNRIRKVTEGDNFVDMKDVQSLISETIGGPGLDWRLEDLNLSVGPVQKSDFIIIGKRPETGGTSFVSSEFTYMASQLPEGKKAIIFNNEEGGGKIGTRLVQSALNITTPELVSDPVKAANDYAPLSDKIMVYSDPYMTTRSIQRVLRENPECYLICINVLDKVQDTGGRKGLDETQRLRELAWWCRRLADEYGSVWAVWQLGEEAENMMYPTAKMLYGSKTGVQGEADIQIMIGVNPDNDTPGNVRRYFSIVKNKKPISGRMIPDNRHAKFAAKFDVERGRFIGL